MISKYDPNYSAMSLDEAYLDLSDHLLLRSGLEQFERTFLKDFNNGLEKPSESDESITFGIDAEECVREIRHRIYLRTKLTASAGE